MLDPGKFGAEVHAFHKSPSHSETTSSRLLQRTFAVIFALITVLSLAALAQQTRMQDRDEVTIQGKVLNSGGKSVAEASVWLEQESTLRHMETKADAAGTFAFTDLPPGRYLLSAEKSGQKTHGTVPLA